MSNKVYIVVLNYQNSADTLVCLNSLFNLEYENFEIILVDNYSNDGSLEEINSYIDNLITLGMVASKTYNSRLELGGDAVGHGVAINIIHSDSNKGFAGGNNLGVLLAMERGDADNLWILNNDTIVSSDSLCCLLSRAKSYERDNKKIGIIGSKLNYLEKPEIIQGVGGVYNKFWGTTTHIGDGEVDTGQYDFEDANANVDYPVGASMFVPISFIKEVGMMSEKYFLYYEEFDWVVRGKRLGWSIGYDWQAKILHKCGGTIGSSSDWRNRSAVSDYYCLRNRAVITFTHYPWFLLPVFAGYFVVIVNRLRRGQFRRLLDFWRWTVRDVKQWIK